MANGTFTNYLADNGWGAFSPTIGQMTLAQLPQATYFSSPAGEQFAAGSPRQSRYMQRAYQDVYSTYLGEIGRQLRQGQAPTTFRDYLEDESPWTASYAQLPRYERGVTQQFTNPKTRFIFY